MSSQSSKRVGELVGEPDVRSEVLNDAVSPSAVSEHGRSANPSTCGEEESEDGAHDPHFGKVPVDGSSCVRGVVVGDCERSDGLSGQRLV